MSLIYRNRTVINQRGGSLDIDNTTESEKVKLSHRSGSNISFTNVVNSELATTNKQINVVHDSFETVGNDKSTFVGSDYTLRTGENTYTLKGFIDQSQLNAFQTWKDTYEPIAKLNSQFKIKRKGQGYPNGDSTEETGNRADNPVINSKVYTVNNEFSGYSGTPLRKSDQDDVAIYSKVPSRSNILPAQEQKITKDDILTSAGKTGSKAPGVIEFGAEKSAASENGKWDANVDAQEINKAIAKLQETLIPIEQNMGNGGDDINFIKRNKAEQIGAVFNDYPSIRIDEKGRTQPLELLVSATGTFKNYDYVPHIEEVDNSSNFPGGNDDKIVGNRYSRIVGSGGIQLKTTGNTELGGATLKGGFKRINLNASHGIQIASESFVELQSLKTITLRTNRQVYISNSLGIGSNLIVKGGASIEGELYIQHVTAPLEVHQTEDTIVFGKFATDTAQSLVIGQADIGGTLYPVYALPSDNLIINYPHSHHHNGIPMRLTKSNSDVRKFAQKEQINNHSNIAQSLPQLHEKKNAVIA
jgi:hypothetical protein